MTSYKENDTVLDMNNPIEFLEALEYCVASEVIPSNTIEIVEAYQNGFNNAITQITGKVLQ